MIAESDASGNITREYIYLNGHPLALIDVPLPPSAPPQTISQQVSMGCSSIFVWDPQGGILGYVFILSPFFFLVFFQVTRNWRKSGVLLLVVLGASFAVSLVVVHRAKAQETGEKIYYYHNDHLGSPIKLTDQSQNVVWTWQYGPFGEEPLLMNPNTISQNLRFPGQYYDAETGLHYNMYRYYSPKLGRYLTPDPIRGSRRNAQSYNPFPYGANNPIKFIDSSGLFLEKIFNNPEQRAGHLNQAISYQNFVNYSQGKSWEELVTDAGESFTLVSAKGPEDQYRYVIDPANPNQVIDMRHFLVIGMQGELAGLGVELLQLVGDPKSAFDAQDFLSNYLGKEFFTPQYYNPSDPNLAEQLKRFFEDRAKKSKCQ